MKILVSSNEMKYADEMTSAHFGIDSLILMERAALKVADEIEKKFDTSAKILIMAGSGGNGGDGVCIGRILALRGYRVSICLYKVYEECNASCQKQIDIANAYGISILAFSEWKLGNNTDSFDVIVDGLLGNGINKPVHSELAQMIQWLNQSTAYIYSLDIPSGISTDSGAILGTAVRANETICFGFLKKGLCFYPGREYAGKIQVVDVGITKESFLGNVPTCYAFENRDLNKIWERPAWGNKGSFGKVLIIAGSQGMTGACIFAAKSALRMGAGMVKIMTHASLASFLQQEFPEAMLSLYDEETTDETFQEMLGRDLDWANVCLIGPGISVHETSARILNNLSKTCFHTKCKNYVMDADAINVISKDSYLKEIFLNQQELQIVFTPHVLEFSRLSQISMEELKKNFYHEVTDFVKKQSAIFVCKDATSIVGCKDFQFINLSGSNALATAGSGDCLAGMIAGVLAQKDLFSLPIDFHEKLQVSEGAFLGEALQIFELTALAVYLHGLLGEHVAITKSCAGVITSDLVEEIPNFIQKLHILKED